MTADHDAACVQKHGASLAERVCSNDVFVGARGIIYLIDRTRDLSILERS